MTPGSEHEPSAVPIDAADQMRDVTDRLRDQAWMVAPMTTAVTALPGGGPEQESARRTRGSAGAPGRVH